jgi:Na+/proline symporter
VFTALAEQRLDQPRRQSKSSDAAGTGNTERKAEHMDSIQLRALDYAVIAVYLLIMLAMGWWCGRNIKGCRRYFIGTGRLHPVVVGLAILATYLSALTMIALPGMAYGEHDWTYTVQLPFLVLTAFVITRFVLPAYREAGVISVYAFLEQRIHVSARLVGAISFIMLSFARMSILLYLTALALHTATGLPIVPTIITMGVVTVFYTAVGGIEAVIWTDVVQAVLFIVAALLSVFYVMSPSSSSSIQHTSTTSSAC